MTIKMKSLPDPETMTDEQHGEMIEEYKRVLVLVDDEQAALIEYLDRLSIYYGFERIRSRDLP